MDPQKQPFVDVITRQYVPSTQPAAVYPWYESKRFKIFLITFILTSIIGLIYVFSQPAIYQSKITLLTVAPPAIDQALEEINVQHVAIQGNLLTSQSLIEATLNALASESPVDLPEALNIRKALYINIVPDTNLITLTMEGSDAAFQPIFLNELISQYKIQRIQQIQNDSSNTSATLKEQLMALETKIEDKRTDIINFRNKYNIVSIGRDENQVSARLNSLTTALNTAETDQINAKATLSAIKKAINQGQPVVPDTDKRVLANMEKRAQELSEKMDELDRRYSRKYIALQPNLKVIPEQLEKLRKDIARNKINGRNIVLSDAEQEYTRASQATISLTHELDDYKQTATNFTRYFAEQEAMTEDLAQMELALRETQLRLTQIDVLQREKYPQFDVIEPSFKPNESIRPNYLQNTGIVLALSLLFGLLVIWLYEFLKQDSLSETPAMASWSRISTSNPNLNLQSDNPQTIESNQPSHNHTISYVAPRQLSIDEIKSLLNACSSKGQLVVCALLQGLTINEITQLKQLSIDDSMTSFSPPSKPIRTLPLSDRLCTLLTNNTDIEISETEATSLVSSAAYDAELAEPETISIDSISQSYLTFLLQQGIKLADLEKVIGTLTTHTINQFTDIAKTVKRSNIEKINLIYPV
ncbi:MAG: hypothetical protein COB26_00945, partial [Piscirickettsiaceae bacterium]